VSPKRVGFVGLLFVSIQDPPQYVQDAFKDLMIHGISAIRITFRSSLRSSSLREPRYPLLRVVCFVCLFRFVLFCFVCFGPKATQAPPPPTHTHAHTHKHLGGVCVCFVCLLCVCLCARLVIMVFGVCCWTVYSFVLCGKRTESAILSNESRWGGFPPL